MEPSPNELAFDSALQNSGSVDCFLDDFFSFLCRRTDFFLECPPEGGPAGFLKGDAEKMLITKFKKYQTIHDSQESKNLLKLNAKKVKPVEINRNKDPKQPIRSSTELSESDSYNGQTTDLYSWSQSIADLDLKVKVDPSIKKGKQVDVEIKSDFLSVTIGENEVIKGKLSWPIVKNDSYWNLVPGEALHIWLQKAQERWWQSLLEGEEPIDMSKINSEKPMEDLGQEEQMKIQELMHEQELKMKGLKTGKETEMEDLLKKAWNVDGSPFKGQPFDPSKVNFSGSP